MSATPRTLRTLRFRVLSRVLVPLALTWTLGSALTVSIGYVRLREVLDRSLLDDALAIASQVGWRGDGPTLQLSAREMSTVLFDPSEKVFFALLRADGSMVAGHGGLRDGGALPAEPGWVYADRHWRGMDVRTVTLMRDDPGRHAVVVAQTVSTRTQLLQQLLVVSILPQVVLLAALGGWLRHSVGRELRPLSGLRRALDRRDANDLSPVPVDAHSLEVHDLGLSANQLMARIASGVQAQREFTGNVAHELRTPLAAIRSLAEHGLAQSDPAAWRAQLERVLLSGDRASHLIDQLLALALADEARDSIVLEPVALDEVVRELLLRTLPRADAAGVDLGASGLDDPCPVRGQRALLEGLLGNLLDNALRYGRPGDGVSVPRVTVSIAREGATVRLSVIDNGPGLEPELHGRVLDRGAQGEAGRLLGQGSGLGLAIVSRYAELLGSRLELRPGEGEQGLCATVALPAAVTPGVTPGT